MKGFAFVNIVITSFLVLLVSISPAMSEHSELQSDPDIYVATTGSDETGNGSEEHPYRTIQNGIDVAINGNTVR